MVKVLSKTARLVLLATARKPLTTARLMQLAGLTRVKIAMADKITAQTTIGEIIEKHPERLEVLAKHLHGQCFGCPMAQIETLEEAAMAHKADLAKILADLNQSVSK